MIELPVVGKIGIPFLLAGVVATQVNKTRIIEAVVIACISSALMAAAGYFIALPVLQEQMATLRRDIQEIKSEVKDTRIDLDARRQRRDDSQAKLEAKIIQLQIEMAKRRCN